MIGEAVVQWSYVFYAVSLKIDNLINFLQVITDVCRCSYGLFILRIIRASQTRYPSKYRLFSYWWLGLFRASTLVVNSIDHFITMFIYIHIHSLVYVPHKIFMFVYDHPIFIILMVWNVYSQLRLKTYHKSVFMLGR